MYIYIHVYFMINTYSLSLSSKLADRQRVRERERKDALISRHRLMKKARVLQGTMSFLERRKSKSRATLLLLLRPQLLRDSSYPFNHRQSDVYFVFFFFLSLSALQLQPRGLRASIIAWIGLSISLFLYTLSV